MLRSVLVGATRTIPATMREINGTASATIYPAYVTGAADYESMANKPSINGVVLEGNLTLEDIGIFETSESDIDALFDEIYLSDPLNQN